MKRFARMVLYVVATVVLGDLLARYIAGLPYEMLPLTDSIQSVLRAVGLNRLDNVDDLETLALVFILLASIVATGLILILAVRGGRALLARVGK